MRRSQLTLSVDQLNELQTCLKWIGREVDVRYGLLADLSGQEIASWSVQGNFDVSSIAALAAGELLATLEIARLIGGKRTCNLIIQEHDEHTVLMSRVGEGLLLLIVTAREVPIGWSRMAIKETTVRIAKVLSDIVMIPPPPAVSEDFETQFSAQLDTIW